MAQGSMSGDFIQNMLAMLQLKQQASQFAQQQGLARQAQQTQMLQSLASIGQGIPDAGDRWDFMQAQGGPAGIPLDALLALARGQAPSETAIRASAANAGRAAMDPATLGVQNAEAASVVGTGMNQQQAGLSAFLNSQLGRMGAGGQNAPVANMLGEAGVLRMLAGMSPGQFSLDQATHNLGPEEITSAARISQGLSLSAPQVASNALTARGQDLGYSSSMAGNRLGWASLAQQGELGHLDLAMRQQLSTMQAGGKGGLQISDIPELVKTQQSIVEALGKSATPAQRQSYLNSLGTVNSLLNSMGVPTPQINPTGDVNQFTPFNLMHPISTWGGRSTLPMFNPADPRNQQYQFGVQQFGGGAR